MRLPAFGFVLAVLPLIAWAQEPPQRTADFIGPAPMALDHNDLSPNSKMRARVAADAARLLATSPRLPAAGKIITKIGWPLRIVPGLGGEGYHGVSNFVDLNPAIGAVKDFACGTRSYDLASGYNHQGNDLFSWPFGWARKNSDALRVVAAAPGVIITRHDGEVDTNCVLSSAEPNYIVVQHSDGSQAWYLHMKRGSLTAKQPGSSVQQGEFLGVVASSGSSTGPHLHFELWDSSGAIVEANQGACNTSAATYAVQRPYVDPAILLLATHSAPPVFPTCPGEEVPNFSDRFQPGDRLYGAIYVRDLRPGDSMVWSVLRPDGSQQATWTETENVTYNGAYSYYYLDLPKDAAPGVWVLRVVYKGVTSDHRFAVGNVALIDPANGWWYNPAEGGRGFSIERRGNAVFMASYLYDSDGKALWLASLGQMRGNSVTFSLDRYGNGQTLTGAYVAPKLGASPGSATLTFTSSTRATLSWPGGTIPLQRYEFVAQGASLGASFDAPETGWYYAPSEGGRGYFLEVQGTTMFLAAYMYDASGTPVWYVAQAAMDSPTTFTADLVQYAGGQTLTGAYQAPKGTTTLGQVRVTFSSATDAVLTLPGGATTALVRYRF